MADSNPTYAEKLRAALDREGWSQARLVRDLAVQTGNAPESERSAVRGYLAGSMPRSERARLIADITGVPELAEAENPRESATARLERRLEEVAANQMQLLENQKRGTVSLTAQLRAVQRTLESLVERERTLPKSSRQAKS